ncbi:TetR family transcriptional regulator [Listeria monocytogenes]|uniref:TetR/AcrR family transcriptional regulator n=1 Tax=Listeria monocytogenes TaxID=1639 RepID=UPI0004D785E6|nr:TetR/AcrR family transcriptional regulator [Listeria monocytogenes]KEX73061.1 TetR family transcriptional regulator [Listeria monocytogenes]
MPKLVTGYERQQTKNLIIEHTSHLIYIKKGIQGFTVEDITRAARIGKRKFYTCFPSKEEKIMEEKGSLKSKMTRFLKEVYLSEKSINNYFSPEDFHAILQKLPPTYTEREARMTSEVLETAMTYIDLTRAQWEALVMLLDCLTYTATRSYVETAKKAKEETLDILIHSIADYVEKQTQC